MTNDAAFWTNIAPKYAKKPISDMDAFLATLERVRTYLSPTDRVIEFGAGTGGTGVRLAPDVSSYLVTDYSPGMIAEADRRKAEGDLENLRTGVGTIADFAAEDVNVVLAFNLFHLVPDMEGDFARIYEMLPPGGLFIQKTPAIAKLWFLKPMIRIMSLFGKAPGTLRYLTPQELDAAVISAGFEVVETGLFPAKSHNRFIVARKPG